MALSCRKACEKLYRDTEFSQLPELVRAMGGYGDVVTDQVGHYLLTFCITHLSSLLIIIILMRSS